MTARDAGGVETGWARVAKRMSVSHKAEDDTLVVCLKALIKARETIYAFHGEPAWELYQQSPEMTAINRAIEVATKVLAERG